jgi:hypothetical protein
MTPEALFVSLFGVAKATWRDLPMVQHLSCTGSCTTELLGTIAQATGPAQVWVDGDLTLDGPIELGSTERPVVVVVSGQLQLRGDVQLHGMLHARAAAWSQPATSAAALQGALVTETDYTGDAAGTFVYDARVLDTLRQAAGSFVRVPGSWRDF